MDDDILNAIEDLRVPSLHQTNGSDGGERPNDLVPYLGDWYNFSKVVSWIGEELKAICSDVEEVVTPLQAPSSQELMSFKMELSSLLKELGCLHETILQTELGDRFESVESRRIVLAFLLGELQAARMIKVNGKSQDDKKMERMNVQLEETPTAKILREMCQELEIGKPPENLTPTQLWATVIPKIKSRLGNTPPLDPLFTGVLTPSQWEALANYEIELKSDYQMRREMLLKRLDVTIQSFKWSDRFKGDKEVKIDTEFRKLRSQMNEVPGVKMTNVLAARADLAVIDKTSSTSVRKNTRSEVNKVVIGRVPDRGGRPDEVQPPPPEMPSWQQRQGAPSGSSGWIQNPNARGQGPRGGGSRGGGGRVQGGWAKKNEGQGDYQQHQQGNYQGHQQWQQQGGNYGGYDQGGGGGGGHRGGGHYQNEHDNRDSYNQGGDYYQQDRRGGGGGQGQYHDDRQGGHRGRGGGGYQGRGGGRNRRY